MDPEHPSADPLLAPTPEYLASVKVCPLIPALKKDITVNSALSWEQLTASDINFAIVRPLVVKYARLQNMAVVYACLVVRSYFLAQSEINLAFTGVMQSRANLCELLAIKLSTYFASHSIARAAVLCTAWNPLAGATPQVMQDVRSAIHSELGLETAQTAIEMAIATRAKAFLASPVTQNVINDLYAGNVVFSLNATRSILADNYKPRAIQIYDVRKAPFLNHYRLRVPRYTAILEFLNFTCLMLAFVLCLANQDKARITFWEAIFILWASACALEEYTASTENGWYIYIANMWNAFDFSFTLIFLVYLCLRINGLYYNDLRTSSFAFDVLACGACILFPRLAFFAVANHIVILSIQAMIVQFVVFMGTVIICFSGLFFTLWTLGMRLDHWSFSMLGWYLIQIWLGNSYVVFSKASSIHPIFGTPLVTIFAVFSNTLLVTILISILSNTVARIDANATQEYLFQFAISTIEGFKNDALFSYQPPFNIMAFLILKPASWFLSPRALHRVNVFLIKVTSLPQLLAITVYERYLKSGGRIRQTSKDFFRKLPQHIKQMPFLDALVGSSHSDVYDAILDMDVDELDFFSEFGDEDEPILGTRHSKENLAATSSRTQLQEASFDFPSSSPTGTRRRMLSRNRVLSTRINSTPTVTAPQQHTRSLSTSTQDQKKGEENYGAVASGPALRVSIPNTGIGNSSMMSPLARLFSNRTSIASSVAGQTLTMSTPEGTLNAKKVEALLEEMKDLPITRLSEEMKDLRERQVRIENLLLTLTRNMGNGGS
ncbi:hypothetical protein AGABI2DRAFT_66204 [Agaricus bisporus var. bisporus H97]|uniref:hypothetical protein n=1 Tax=Agaricus bisporus var. bisporus (strain H97 / ATCC MYA-4626 / FGSC 10389) TaxID=936046 RepID=UPI00029F6F98|nr:hypothetical protein AGABI2DRAFT_66204 [Agaricus bisporus var. bisporus H97]EKV49024.1 hypothetical protein AGABI2DRAFT_66204 [Agaricus bisporus var. bisporus H97]